MNTGGSPLAYRAATPAIDPAEEALGFFFFLFFIGEELPASHSSASGKSERERDASTNVSYLNVSLVVLLDRVH